MTIVAGKTTRLPREYPIVVSINTKDPSQNFTIRADVLPSEGAVIHPYFDKEGNKIGDLIMAEA